MVYARYNEHYNGDIGLIMVSKPTFTSPGCHSQAIPTWGLSRHKSGPIAPCSQRVMIKIPNVFTDLAIDQYTLW